MERKLYKSETDKMLCGVLGGLAERFHIDSTILRIAYAALAVFSAVFPCAILYLVCAMVMPKPPVDTV